MKCNLDCSYCSSDLYGGHLNSVPHPPLDQCLKTIDFMFDYVDLYMQQRRKALHHVVLNVYGGESLYHPHIVTLLEQARSKHQSYQSRWSLTVTTTTNAVVSSRQLAKIIPLIDEFTVSYHSEAKDSQKQQFKKNLLAIQQSNKRLKCVVLMHADDEKFADSQAMIQWLADHDIKYLPRQLDHSASRTDLNYTQQQVVWFENLYKNKSYVKKFDLPPLIHKDNAIDLAASGRACCGGRQLCANQQHSQRIFYVDNHFKDWFCSVNHFFLYIKQVTGEIFVNKDCKMNFAEQIAPIGNLARSDDLLAWTKQHLQNKTMPVIKCQKQRCYCGLCAPKAQSLKTYHEILGKYEISTSNLLS